MRLAEVIKRELGNKFPIFSSMTHAVVGSMKEQTRICNVDEVDITVSLPAEYEIFSHLSQKRKKSNSKHTMCQKKLM